jgi:hypothetical protein
MTDVSKKATELSADLLEPAIDSVFESGFLRDIPLLGAAIKLADLARSVSDRIFLTKVKGFIHGLRSVGATSAEEFAQDIIRDEKTAKRTGQVLLLSIDAINDLDKAPILAYVFAAFLRNEISLTLLQRLNGAVNLALVEDLWALAEEPQGGHWEEESYQRRLHALRALRITGLSSLSDSAFAFVGKRSFIGTEITGLGEILVRILRKSPGMGGSDQA